MENVEKFTYDIPDTSSGTVNKSNVEPSDTCEIIVNDFIFNMVLFLLKRTKLKSSIVLTGLKPIRQSYALYQGDKATVLQAVAVVNRITLFNNILGLELDLQ